MKLSPCEDDSAKTECLLRSRSTVYIVGIIFVFNNRIKLIFRVCLSMSDPLGRKDRGQNLWKLIIKLLGVLHSQGQLLKIMQLYRYLKMVTKCLGNKFSKFDTE